MGKDGSDTYALRPGGPRPPDLWRAWERTAGYVAHHTNQAVALTLTWTAQGAGSPWTAQFNWANNSETVAGQPGAGEALVALWGKVKGYSIFETPQDAGRAPENYPANFWFQDAENAIFERLIRLATDRYRPAATLVIGYHPMGNPELRAQARLISRSDTALTVGGQGLSLLDACRDLYRKAALKLGVKDEG